ncbi:DUF2470 domain-containing protein [Compostimonas suwonensis]|nr:DUF2470 domain-containing protein [Compostimonas suwonensis]
MSHFSPEIIHAVVSHMNGDHVDDNLMIVRAFAEPTASSALMTGLDGEAGIWAAVVDGSTIDVRVPWSKPITERPEIRREVVTLYNAACERLGVEPRAEH